MYFDTECYKYHLHVRIIAQHVRNICLLRNLRIGDLVKLKWTILCMQYGVQILPKQNILNI